MSSVAVKMAQILACLSALGTGAVLLAGASVPTGCRSPGVGDPGPPVPATAMEFPNYAVGEVTEVEVPGDRSLLVIHGAPEDERAIVYLHGMCTKPDGDAKALAPLAERHGTFVFLKADAACGDGAQWTQVIADIDARVGEALRVVKEERRGALATDRVTVVGYSMGATRAEALAGWRPQAYPRVVLVGGPNPPTPEKLQGAAGVATVAGTRDRQDLMEGGARGLSAAGIRSRFFTIPDAAHGEYGPSGVKTMDEVLAFVAL